MHLDFQTEQIRTIPFPSGFALVIVESGVKHSLLQSQYNARREECAAAAQALGATSLRAVTPERLEQARPALEPLLYRRAAHIVGENERVARAIEAMTSGDSTAIGALMNSSHESSRVNFENSTPELDLLVSIAQSIEGVRGSRLTGGGFGGGTVTLVEARRAEDVVQQMQTQYEERSPHKAAGFVCRSADGAAMSWS